MKVPMQAQPKKFLCVCQDGNVRSVGLAFRIHNLYGHEAVPVGWNRLTKLSLYRFCQWADYIVVLQAEYAKMIDPEFADKVRVAEVGPDNYGRHSHRDLQEKLAPIVAEWAANGWQL